MSESVEQRFWNKVDRRPDNECWEWQASRTHGYGSFGVDGKNVRAHRVAYELVKGPIPDGLVIDHVCENRACVNPAHLEAVTHLENIRRGYRRDVVHPPTHCVNGHPLSPDNVYVHHGSKACRMCRQMNHRVEKAKAQAVGFPSVNDEERERRRLAPTDRTHCKHGHPWTPENIYVSPRGYRRCRECHRIEVAAKTAAKRAAPHPIPQTLGGEQ